MPVEHQVTQPGDGVTFPRKGDKVKFHYVGKDSAGKEFDNTYTDHDRPFETEIGTGKVIQGWDQGIMKLSKGEKARLTITPDLAFGSEGMPPVIPANATLIFDIWLLDITPRRH
ncbi:hypothetical protein NP233_g8112 [Leucocoprinus birnbaumii]|uniref:peptidylprolyl isomerase n=1 Tax=Leucocoprinus birnbaumii TaxID=56174 RepID=A0AAD5YPC9_9AGAR|nr:hypothetical protein NP233_g8112 [Leucocoprinus birnbaumii]